MSNVIELRATCPACSGERVFRHHANQCASRWMDDCTCGADLSECPCCCGAGTVSPVVKAWWLRDQELWRHEEGVIA